MEKHILAPAKRFLRPHLARKRLGFDQIVWKNFEDFPDLNLDATLMTQVVFNLMENAVKYHRRPPEEFYFCITGGKTEEGDCRIEFEDHGIGIPGRLKERIFERGFRIADESLEIPGDGLGLWYARQIVERHSGTLYCANPQGPTRFVLTLPQKLILPARSRI